MLSKLARCSIEAFIAQLWFGYLHVLVSALVSAGEGTKGKGENVSNHDKINLSKAYV